MKKLLIVGCSILMANLVQAQSIFLPVGSGPFAVQVSQDSTQAFVVNRSTNSVSFINLADNTVTKTIAVGKAPGAVLLGIWASCCGKGCSRNLTAFSTRALTSGLLGFKAIDGEGARSEKAAPVAKSPQNEAKEEVLDRIVEPSICDPPIGASKRSKSRKLDRTAAKFAVSSA